MKNEKNNSLFGDIMNKEEVNDTIDSMVEELVIFNPEMGKPVTDSLTIAKAFGKLHKHVIRDIELELTRCSDNFGRSNFGPSSYKNSQGKSQPKYNLTRDGFTMIAMGYKTAKGTMFREKFIAAFNAMEARLLEMETSRTDRWIEVRIKGKIVRRNLTEMIDEFVKYARSQGSTGSGYYFKHITSACNTALWGVESLRKIKKNTRDELGGIQLYSLLALEKILIKNLERLLKEGIHYKEIYKRLKEICVKYHELEGDVEKPERITPVEHMRCLVGDQHFKHLYGTDRKTFEKSIAVDKGASQLQLF